VIAEPGFFDLSADEYHADPCPVASLSTSIAKILVQPGGTPLHAWFEHPRLNPAYKEEVSEKFDLGAAAHSLMLKDPQDFAIIDEADWKTNRAKGMRDAARAAGAIPMLKHRHAEAMAMVEAADAQLDLHDEARDFFADGHGLPEQTIIWQEGDVWCRARLDWKPNTGRLYPDYKTTAASADPILWQKTAIGAGFDVQASFYCRGLRALGIDYPKFRFVVQENYPPFALSVIALSPSLTDLADRKVSMAIEIWRSCMQQNNWPGYPPYTSFLETRAWDEAEFLSRSAAHDDALRLAREGQAPL
jgi:hypothetical protein